MARVLTTTSAARRVVGVCLLSLLVLGTTGADCSQAPEASVRLGAQLANGGDVEVVYRSCPGELVTTVTVVEPPSGSQQEKVLWAIESDDETGGPLSIGIGTNPSGWSTLVSLETNLPSVVIVRVMSAEGVSTDFLLEPADLEAGRIWNGAESFSPEEFASRAQESCG